MQNNNNEMDFGKHLMDFLINPSSRDNSTKDFFKYKPTNQNTSENFKKPEYRESDIEHRIIRENSIIRSIEFAVPGFRKNDFKIFIQDNFLFIEFIQNGDGSYWRIPFKRKVNLEGHTYKNINATLENGILKIDIEHAALTSDIFNIEIK